MPTGRESTRSSSRSSCLRFKRENFSLTATLTSGQVFRWQEVSQGTYTGWIDSHPVWIRQRNGSLTFRGTEEEAIVRFFWLDVDLPTLLATIDVDPIVHSAVRSYFGLRLIRQEPWECLASFILSSFNNIPRLTGMLDRLAEQFGERNRFPRAQVLAKVSERVLRNLGLGFRAPYLKAAAEAVTQGKADLEGWKILEDEALRRALSTIPGVGEKVVECVMLFAYQRQGAFPVDVWIGRAMRRWYFKGRKATDRQIRGFARRHFGPCCGWAQQYLYCYARGLSKSSLQNLRYPLTPTLSREGRGKEEAGGRRY